MFWIVQFQSDHAFFLCLCWWGHQRRDLLIICNEGVAWPHWKALARIWVPLWVAISARVVTCKYILQLLSVWRSLGETLAWRNSSMMWVSYCCSFGIVHGFSRTIFPSIECKTLWDWISIDGVAKGAVGCLRELSLVDRLEFDRLWLLSAWVCLMLFVFKGAWWTAKLSALLVQYGGV